MKVKDVAKYMEQYDPEEEIVISWFTREDAEHWTDEKIDDDMWNVIMDDIGFDSDDIYYTIKGVKQYRKDELYENTGQISR